MIRRLMKKLLAPIVREVLIEEREHIVNAVLRGLGKAMLECLEDIPVKGVTSEESVSTDS